MKLYSLVRDGDALVPAEVEIFLFPGLPQIHFLGLPDQVIKESLLRIKSALRNQEFEFPTSRQVVVNIRPNHLRKSSRGLELAVAVGLLIETGQVPRRLFDERTLVYGELALDGRVIEPGDLVDSFSPSDECAVLTGDGSGPAPFLRERVSTLRDLAHPTVVEPDLECWTARRPVELLESSFSTDEADLLAVLGVGGHSALLAGRAGCGKSHLLKTLPALMDAPSEEDFRLRRVRARWRPVVKPHHSAPPVSMIGGGVPPQKGEISRADGGLLVLDELLEFDRRVQEALREPAEEGVIRLSRGTRSKSFAAGFQLVATTNLCPCGRWQPGLRRGCAHSNRRCLSNLDRLSGPFLDRFEILWFPPVGDVARSVSGPALFQRVEDARPLLREMESRESTKIPTAVATAFAGASERRKKAACRVARTWAALGGRTAPAVEDWERALEGTLRSFLRLQRG